MVEVKYAVYLMDELPKIGCGYRTVYVKEGRKWVYVSDAHGRKQRITMKKWVPIRDHKNTKLLS